ncbi:alpha/beta hydrolase [Amycolatopsis saalfeldensis]|uniref:Pimeloyl-ACP methyl ester carboxylesterase n=1 Tax=Amycolatopsis saalfeldensis TaxID=394193 RepID=A0A1H8YFZ6_9PSEU|nr:alpha/beta hydrolase [Amycolatopsis saalfeldensis]SEP51134.1 Pimeloyl-ACP methyl ester carboxylesterase [Amycolatopsis saalfeldensis]
MPDTPIVLVHGSYHQPAHYTPLVSRLTEIAGSVSVPDIGLLPLPESIKLVQDIVDRAAAPPVVVGHSFGGAVAGSLRGVRRMVFLSGWVLDVDETAVGWLAEDPAGGSEFAQALRFSEDGAQARIDPGAATSLFYADCPPDVAAHAVELLRPDTVLNFQLSPTAAEWKHTPSLYVATRRDRTWPPALVTEFSRRCTETVTVDTGHSPYLSAPDRIAGIIGECLE